jgi:hypothetical protein
MRRTSRICLMLRRSMCAAPNSRKVANLSCAHSIRHRISWLKRILALWRSGAGVVELVDARHSKCRSERSVGSIPTARTIIQTSQNSPRTGTWIVFEWGEMQRTDITPRTCEMTAERLSCWPPESRTGFGHRLANDSKSLLIVRLSPKSCGEYPLGRASP